MPARSDNGPQADEETALLANAKRPPIPTQTPLEWSQISIILLLQLCEPLTSQSIFPYINQLISELGITRGDNRKVGYYAGLIESLFFATEALTVLQWSRVSDYVGRRPVLLIGSTGLWISILCFGLSRTFWGLVASRCLNGMLNGNIGVMKSAMGELTDSTNRAEGFAFMPVVWAAGSTLGPLIGGTLSKPHDRFPTVFSGTFWKKYPYFLPCAAVAGFIAITSIILLVFFKETVQTRKTFKSQSCSETESTLCTPAGAKKSPPPKPSRNQPVPLRQLLEYRVVISIANYIALAFLNVGLFSLQPLFFAMPINIGGLGLSPPTIGYILGVYGATSGIFQVFFFSKIIRRFGIGLTFLAGMASFIPMFCLFPIMSIIAQGLGMSPLVWALIVVQFTFAILMDMAYGCIFIYITSASPNARSLGSTNGLAQTTVSVARAIGPAMSTSLFSFSVENNILGGYGVYAFMTLLSTLALFLVLRLPRGEWKTEAE